MTKRAIANVRIVLPHGVEPATLLVDGGRIVDVRTGAAAIPGDEYEIVDGGGRYCAPGLIDIHVHGGGGFDLMTDDAEQVRGYARWIATRGITSFLVSTSGRDHAEIVRRLRAIAPAVGVTRGPHPLTPSPQRGEGGLIEGAARVLGFHLEGPYINPVRKGAFPPAWLRAPSADEYRELAEASGGTVRQVTLAPELPGADALISAVVASGATAAIGHTDATHEQAMRAIELGASHVTHCFNAMRPFGHRDPGVLGAVMTSDALTAELIGDGAHVDYAAARVLIRAKGSERVVLITDGMPLAGTPDGGGSWEAQAIRVEGGKAVRVADGTIIGGVITLDQTVRNAVAHMGVSLHDAVAMASTNAARALRLDDYGVLAAGRAADFVLLDDALAVTETWVAGERVWTALALTSSALLAAEYKMSVEPQQTDTGVNWDAIGEIEIAAFQQAGWAESSEVSTHHLALALLLRAELASRLVGVGLPSASALRTALTGKGALESPSLPGAQQNEVLPVRRISLNNASFRQALLAGAAEHLRDPSQVYATILHWILEHDQSVSVAMASSGVDLVALKVLLTEARRS